MAVFIPFLHKLLKYEGSYVNNLKESGGATKMGITMAAFIKYAPKMLGESLTLANFKAITPKQADKYINRYTRMLSKVIKTRIRIRHRSLQIWVNALSIRL
ncbi:MAG: hypothetical protein JST83_14050 [Bacteroidetes bacterium]|nr:hypothetical protein [Bacteroidota bacterium]